MWILTGWDCLICHVDFLTQFFPEKATEVACGVLDELIKDDYMLLRECISGQIYDSSPVNFSDDLNFQFVLHPSFLKMTYPPRMMSWMAKLSHLVWMLYFSTVLKHSLLNIGRLCIRQLAWVLSSYFVLKMINWLPAKLCVILLNVYKNLVQMSTLSSGAVLLM